MTTYVRFCGCKEESLELVKCHCGEESSMHEWLWEDLSIHQVQLCTTKQDVRFHPGYSMGTAAVRGDLPLVPGRQYIWEIKMLSGIYGTDVMVGVGTAKVNLMAHENEFISLLGKDSESWGLSYKGEKTHNGARENYGPPFGKGSLIGVHLDMWAGTLEFYVNRERLGVAFKVTRNQTLYPIVCSTVGNSAMRLVYSMSWPVSLQLTCLQSISSLPSLAEIPGLRATWGDTLWWKHATELKVNEFPHQEQNTELEIVSSEEEEDYVKRYKALRRNVRRNKKLSPIPAPSAKHEQSQAWQGYKSLQGLISRNDKCEID